MSLFVAFWLLGALVGLTAANHRGFSQIGGLIGGFLLGPMLSPLLFLVSPTRKKCPYCDEWISPKASVCPRCQRDVPEEADVNHKPRDRSSFLILLACLTASGIGIVLFASGFPLALLRNINARIPGHQTTEPKPTGGEFSRTWEILTQIAVAMAHYNFDHDDHYPIANSIEDLALRLQPTYMKTVPLQDGWGRAFVVQSTESTYTISSHGGFYPMYLRNGDIKLH